MLFFTSIPLGMYESVDDGSHVHINYRSIGMIIGSIITDSSIEWQWALRGAPVIGLPLLIGSAYLIEVR